MSGFFSAWPAGLSRVWIVFSHGPAGLSRVWICFSRCEIKILTPRKINPLTPDALPWTSKMQIKFLQPGALQGLPLHCNVDWLKAPIGLAQAPIRRQSMLIGSLRQSGANHLRQSIQAPIRRQSMRQSEEASINCFPWGNACNSGVLTGQRAQGQARVADWLKAPINWLIWRQSGANR